MTLIHIEAIDFLTCLPVIKEQEEKGLIFMRDEDAGIKEKWSEHEKFGYTKSWSVCTKKLYFNDGKDALTFEDRTRSNI